MERQKLNSALLIVFVAACLSCSSYRPELHRASADGDLTRVKALIESGTDVNIKDEHGTTALTYAVTASQFEVADYLLEKGGKFDYFDDNNVNSEEHLEKKGTVAQRDWIAKNVGKL